MSDLSDINKSDTDSDESVSEVIFTARDISTASSLACSCCEIEDSDLALQVVLEMINNSDIQVNLSCQLDNLIRVINFYIAYHNTLDDYRRLALADLFYRLRHELLFKSLCLYLNHPETKSDSPFSICGISSNRTPDLIIQIDDVFYIFEVTASSSLERAAVSKGLEEAGFESKYQKEFEMLDDKGVPYLYIPVLFDMSNSEGEDYIAQLNKIKGVFNINELGLSLMHFIKKEMALITQSSKSYFTPMAAMLFSRNIPIKKNHPGLEFLYETEETVPVRFAYNEVCVSPQVYNKVNLSWHRILGIIERVIESNDDKVLLVLDLAKHRLKAVRNQFGYDINYYTDIILNYDKCSFFKILKLQQGNTLKESINSDTGVRFIERTAVDRKDYSCSYLIPSCNHVLSKFTPSLGNTVAVIDVDKYKALIRNYFENKYFSVDYHPMYEDILFEMTGKFDSSCGPDYKNNLNLDLLADLQTKNININDLTQSLIDSQVKINSITEGEIPLKQNKCKPPFILPLCDISADSYCSIKHKNESFLNALLNEIGSDNPYTELIVSHALSPEFELYNNPNTPSKTLLKLLAERSQLSQQVSYLQSVYYRKISTDRKIGRARLRDCTDPEIKLKYSTLSQEISRVSKEIKVRREVEKVFNETSLIRLPTKNKKSHLHQLYKKEMSHFRDKGKQSTIAGVGIRNSILKDYEHDQSVFQELINRLCDYRGTNPDLFFENIETKDSRILSDLKKISVERYSKLIEEVKDSMLGHAAAFISRLSHSLLYYSQMPFTSDYIRVDNLGYKNCLLIVKGGKKIFKSKASKFYRLVYPVNDILETWFDCGHADKGSTKTFIFGGQAYAITPWQQMHESILNDSISFYTRVVSFAVLNLNPEVNLKMQFRKIGLNVLLSFHNRRQTEVFLANMRYILLSTLGDFTGITKIFNDFVGFNYDCFQSFVRSSVILNYKYYFQGIMSINSISASKQINFSHFLDAKIINLFTKDLIRTEEDLALMIYSTFLMTKAPYQRPVERSINLKSILSIHDYYSETVGLNLSLEEQYNRTCVKLFAHRDYSEYIKSLFKNDFNIDPNYCAQIGVFADSYFKNRGLTESLHTSWISTINKCWDEMAKSTGLRGDYNELEDFWGQKGYFVVYKSFVKDPQFMQLTVTLLDKNIDADTKRKSMRSLNELYKEKIETNPEFLIFHAVDKVQWRGSREIYVMDINTKAMQQPIEIFMGEVCKMIDNELISIPSNKRSQVIHHAIFEKDLPMRDTLTWYLTLDCTKWAPKSNFIKFAITILNMSCMPPSFKTHFLNYLDKLEKKRVYFNNAEVEVLKNNPQYRPIVEKYLRSDNGVNGYYLEMEYSWVMGIFNYTSSFLHAFNQKYCSYFLFKSSLENYQEETSLVMFAHSDDSGGRLTSSSFSLIKRAVFLYEVHLKKCNHLLSKKKSVISRIYFEILSIIYLFKKLLALLPKFLGGLRFLPTDKGPSQDLMQSYSKCIEVMVAGADFSVAYLVMKFYSYMVWRFYFPNRKPLPINFEMPVQYLGLPDAHPIMVLVCGSDADIVRQMHTGNTGKLIKLHAFVNSLISTIDDDGPIKCLKFKINVRGLKKGFETAIDSLKSIEEVWSISNVNYHSTPLNLMSFLKRLNDPGFIGSLVNESTVRRLSRSYFMRSGESCITKFGPIKLNNLYESLITFMGYSDLGSSLNKLFFEVMDPNDILKLNQDIHRSSGFSKMQFEVFKHLLSSPLKISKYLDNLSMDKRQIVDCTRTLKPTHINIQKSSKSFSTNFDPAQLVSFIKEPDWSWALPNPKSLFTAKVELLQLCDKLGFRPEDLTCDTLLRLCRGYSVKSSKDIYIYSHVPSEIRQVRTYSSLLTFLSVNTIKNKEIIGLVLQLQSGLVDPQYVPCDIDEDVYTLNCCISLIETIMNNTSLNFIREMTISALPEYGWVGGETVEFLEFIKNYQFEDQSYNLIMPNLLILKSKLLETGGDLQLSEFKDSSFYLFTKSQKQKGGWFGSGEVLFYLQGSVILFELYNNTIVSAKTSITGKVSSHHANFINDTFNKININIKPPKGSNQTVPNNELYFGIDMSGCMSFSDRREIINGHPAQIINGYPGIINNMGLYTIRRVSYECFIAKADPILDPKSYKIYTLNVPANEIVTVAKRILIPKQFEKVALSTGSSDFEDFLLTEIMSNYGNDTYIGFNEFIDNFTASELYRVFKAVIEGSMSSLPKKMSCSIVPAQQGSLLRILIDYSNHTGDIIIKTDYNVSPEMMALRSEYPEEMTLVLSERMNKEYRSLYNPSERSEIEESYCKIFNLENKDRIRTELIKMMRYWGYSSLVNTIETFSFSKEERNFEYFNLSVLNNENSSTFSKLIMNLNKAISTVMLSFSSSYDGLEFPLPMLKNKGGIKEVVYNQEMSLVLNCYGFMSYFRNIDIYHVQFLNTFIALLKDEDFCISLGIKLNDDPILCSIPINYKHRRDLVAVYNTLRCSWLKARKVGRCLNYNQKLERLPSNVVAPINLFKEIAVINRSPSSVYYHGFINNSIKKFISEPFEIRMNDQIWRVKQNICELSDQRVPLNNIFQVKMPLKEEVFDSEDWEELVCECEMSDLDDDTILDLWSNFEGNYVKSKHKSFKRADGKTVTSFEISWLIIPFIEGSVGITDYIRQVGENIVILSNMFIYEFSNLPNYEFRMINFSDVVQERVSNMIMHISCNEDIPSVFWDKAFGGSKLNLNLKSLDLVYYDQIRVSRGIITDVTGMGIKITTDIMTNKESIEDYDEAGKIIKEEEQPDIKDEPEEQLDQFGLPQPDDQSTIVEESVLDTIKECVECHILFKEGQDTCVNCGSILKQCEGCDELYTDLINYKVCINCLDSFDDNSDFCMNCGVELIETECYKKNEDETLRFSDQAESSYDAELRGRINSGREATISGIYKSEHLTYPKLKAKQKDPGKIEQAIQRAIDDKLISEEIATGMRQKYVIKPVVSVSLETLFKSLMTEIGMLKSLSDLTKGLMEITKEDYVKMFQSPEHFGLSYRPSKRDSKSIKNSKIRAELGSLNSELPTIIGSGTLTISSTFKKQMLSYCKMWDNMIKYTNFKKDNKKFLVSLIKSIFNSAAQVDSTADDTIWQDMSNKISLYVTEDPEADEDVENDFNFITVYETAARLKYRTSGF